LIDNKLSLLEGKKVGLITNHTGRLLTGEHLADALIRKGVRVTALFGPEHGIRGTAEGGDRVADSVDARTGLPVFSLYGEHHAPTTAMLRDVDLLVYDIQDVGARFYTYISTLILSMESAARKGIPFLVLDRPNPLGRLIDGPILVDSLQSFVGIAPLPTVYGLTPGELAMVANARRWLADSLRAELMIIGMAGWQPDMTWKETGLPWLTPSPNIPTPSTAEVYPATCIFEATNLSEGRGTGRPFHFVGAPFVNGAELARELAASQLPGVHFEPAIFVPTASKHAGRECQGVEVRVTDRRLYQPTLTGLMMLHVVLRLYPDSAEIRRTSFERLFGRGDVCEPLLKGTPPKDIVRLWEGDAEVFRRASYSSLLYKSP
jgi:uncharacterized protein YbbC (DUF1343 family)